MSDNKSHVLRHVLAILVEIVVAIYVIVDSAVSLLFRPVMSLLSSLRIVQRLEGAINALHPYVILVVLAVPFIIAEFAKVFAVFWMSEGHFHTGMTIFIGAYIVSIFVCERILHAGKAKLMTIAWFAVVYNWIMALRDQIFAWFRKTQVWQSAVRFRQRANALLTRVSNRLRALRGGRPRSALERR